MDVGLHNEKMAALLIEHLIAQGVERFCLAPGSRSTSLALAAAHNSHAHCDIHFDERGLGFYALGVAKGSRRPTALIVTSGTAVGNLLPAVMEASNDHVPLVLITADRPQELRECSANQTLDQVKLFSPFVRWQADLPLSDQGLPANFLAAAIGQALYLAQSPRPGPVHLNCMIRKPYFSSAPALDREVQPRECESGQLVPSSQTIDAWAARLSEVKKGLIIVGDLPHNTETSGIFALSEKLGWPIYADILSQMRTVVHSHLIAYFDPLVQADAHQPIEAVVHFGARTVSKSVSEWLKRQSLAFYLHVSDYPTLMDPHYIVTHRLHVSSMLCARLLSDAVRSDPDPFWVPYWKDADKCIESELGSFFSEHSEITEPGIIRSIGKHSSNHGIALFLANSMPIRDADKFFPPSSFPGPVFGNRGVSGIDGNIATAVGIAQGMQRPLIALLGDLAFLHDMNSLALLRSAEHPVCLIIVNNGGGGLFSFLPVYEKKETFERFFAGSHAFTFSDAASLFRIPYAQPQSVYDIDTLLTDFSQNRQSILIEVFTDRTENLKLHQMIAASIKRALCLVAREAL
jgi:2-succinyl-5-enolpyruvyl-6-hydroxy-3-cyclohexene-1-carboxylate synthase